MLLSRLKIRKSERQLVVQDLLMGHVLFLIRLTYGGGENALPAPLVRPALNMMLISKLPFLIILTSRCNAMFYSFLKYFLLKDCVTHRILVYWCHCSKYLGFSIVTDSFPQIIQRIVVIDRSRNEHLQECEHCELIWTLHCRPNFYRQRNHLSCHRQCLVQK